MQRPYLTEVNSVMNVVDFTPKAVIMVKHKRNLRFCWLCEQFGHPSEQQESKRELAAEWRALNFKLAGGRQQKAFL
jgi:hypothetical protein